MIGNRAFDLQLLVKSEVLFKIYHALAHQGIVVCPLPFVILYPVEILDNGCPDMTADRSKIVFPGASTFIGSVPHIKLTSQMIGIYTMQSLQ